ncbi:hypothetical protein QRT07_09920 [Vibrio parahaemolyticus]|nr:hypothetical protein [Vibrio parahaemolyticus]WJE02893.1 hypothetical protein QRT07_09920 [Vibrio parahaemolyticus]
MENKKDWLDKIITEEIIKMYLVKKTYDILKEHIEKEEKKNDNR